MVAQDPSAMQAVARAWYGASGAHYRHLLWCMMSMRDLVVVYVRTMHAMRMRTRALLLLLVQSSGTDPARPRAVLLVR